MKRHLSAILIVCVLAIALGARLYLPTWLKNHINNELVNLNGYRGSVKSVGVELFRGAYTIYEIEIVKTGTSIPVPFVKIKSMDLSVDWQPLLYGKIVSKIKADEPVINFAVNPSGTFVQTGKEVVWSEEIKKLMPFDINRITITNGKLFYRDFSTRPEVNIYLTNMSGTVRNLRNVVDKNNPLPSKIEIEADSIGKGKFRLKGNMNILKPIPDMEINAALENVNLKALNDYFRAFIALDVEKGTFDCYAELNLRNGNVSGYIKPLARNIALIDLKRDANPFKFAWETLATVMIKLFSNLQKDQFATTIPLSGRINNIQGNNVAALGGIIRNAFFKAVEKGFDP